MLINGTIRAMATAPNFIDRSSDNWTFDPGGQPKWHPNVVLTEAVPLSSATESRKKR